MFSSYEKPTTGEGFDDVISVDNIGVLKKALADNVNESVEKLRRTKIMKSPIDITRYRQHGLRKPK